MPPTYALVMNLLVGVKFDSVTSNLIIDAQITTSDYEIILHANDGQFSNEALTSIIKKTLSSNRWYS